MNPIELKIDELEQRIAPGTFHGVGENHGDESRGEGDHSDHGDHGEGKGEGDHGDHGDHGEGRGEGHDRGEGRD